ncbi:MAG TPA: DUF5777 family beta-barrel protein [Vicinamibacterales bacterium]|nr:DUF5777 family beta-barrel protein [Vicinamibacterales bacterium]
MVTARALAALLCLSLAAPALAQDPPPPPRPDSPPPVVVEEIDPGEPDLPFVPSEPDFTLVSLPTSLRLPAGRWGFRVAHRFTRALGQGSLGDLASDFFGFDSSAIVGLEVRYGLRPGLQLALLRTSDRTMQFLGQLSVLQQDDARPFGLDAIAAIQGLDNFTEDYTTTLGLITSRRLADRGAIYAQPMFVIDPLPESVVPTPESGGPADSAFMVGLGARLRLGPSTYVVGEFVPRLSGPDVGNDHLSFALERRKGGHSFQINFSNSFATTLGQVARSYGSSGEWHIGFNITRKFY